MGGSFLEKLISNLKPEDKEDVVEIEIEDEHRPEDSIMSSMEHRMAINDTVSEMFSALKTDNKEVFRTSLLALLEILKDG